MNSVLKIYETQYYYSSLYRIDRIEDPFVQEIVEVWKKNNWRGLLYCIHDEDVIDKDLKATVGTQGQVVAFVLVQTDQEGFWTIRGTWTNYNYRGKHLSTQLLKYVISDFELDIPNDHTPSLDYLWVNINPGVEEVYKKVGFHVYGKRVDCEPQFSVGVYSKLPEPVEKSKFINKYKKHVLF